MSTTKTKHLIALCVISLTLMLVSCEQKTPQEKVINCFNNAIERVDRAKNLKTLNGASTILITDINKSLKGLAQSEKDNIMISPNVQQIEKTYNSKVIEKRKHVK